MRVVVVGSGSMGRRHVANLQALGVRDIVLARSRREGSQALARKLRVPVSHDLDASLQDADAVIVANPTRHHATTALAALRADAHVFLEKPVSDSLRGIRALLQRARARRRVVQVGYQFRYHPLMRTAQAWVRAGRVGRLLGARAWVGQALDTWHPGEDYRTSYVARADLGGGVIHTLSHEFDYLRWLVGDVRAVSAQAGQPSDLDVDAETWADVLLLFSNGALGAIHLDCVRRPARRGFELVGTRGTMEADLLRGVLWVFNERGARKQRLAPRDANAPYRDELAAFLKSIRTRADAMPNLQEGVAVLRIAVAAHRAARTGHRQRV